MFLQLIRELNHSINSNRSNQWDKVNTDVVLQLLSCNITISHLYQMLCSQLHAWSAPPGEWDKGSVLPSLRFEGLAQMDAAPFNTGACVRSCVCQDPKRAGGDATARISGTGRSYDVSDRTRSGGQRERGSREGSIKC